MGCKPLRYDASVLLSRQEFGKAKLGDARLTRRLVLLGAACLRQPHASIPRAVGSWAAAKGAYRFFDNKRVGRGNVMETHIQQTVARAQQDSKVLLVQDTTYLNFTHHPEMEGVGPIGSHGQPNRLQGVLLHSCLAVAVNDHEVLGVLDEQTLIRMEGSKDPAVKLESMKWIDGVKAVLKRLRPEQAIFVFDREGDIFNAAEELIKVQAGFVIRASENRRLETEEGRAYLLDQIRSEPVLAEVEREIPGRRSPRKAQLGIQVGTYRVRSPRQQASARELSLNVLRVTEKNTSPNEKAIEWTLLTDQPIGTPEQALEVVDHYRGRWKIEEWHKALKTGCGIEEREMEDWENLEVLLGILSVVAWQLLALRDAARNGRTTVALTETERKVLRGMYRGLRTDQDYLRAIAKLGGFLARKGDGDPGWIVLWHGMVRLRDMTTGFDLANQ